MSTRPAWLRPETGVLLDLLLDEYAGMVLAHTTEAQRRVEIAEADALEALRRDAVHASMESDEHAANMGHEERR